MEAPYPQLKKEKSLRKYLIFMIILSILVLFTVSLSMIDIDKANPRFLMQKSYEDDEFDLFSQRYNKFYSDDEIDFRKKTFLYNAALIRHHNSLKKSWTLGINHFADLTAEEFKTQFQMPAFDVRLMPNSEIKNYDSSDVPDSID